MKVTTSDSQELNRLRCLLYGDSGCGKTTSCLTLPVESTLIAVTDRSLVPLRGKPYRSLMIEDFEDLRTLIRAFGGQPIDGLDLSTVKTLVVDLLTDCAELCKKEILIKSRPAMTKERTKDERDTPKGIYSDVLSMEDWQLYSTRMSSFISTLCHLPVHVICMCIAGHRENKRTGEIKKGPAFNGQLAFDIPKFFDIVLEMSATVDTEGKPCRVWRSAPTPEVMAKDASGVLDELEPTNWTAIFRKILNNKKGAK